MSFRPRRFKSDLNFAVAKKFREAGIEISNPQRDIYIRSGNIQVTSAPALPRDGQHGPTVPRS